MMGVSLPFLPDTGGDPARLLFGREPLWDFFSSSSAAFATSAAAAAAAAASASAAAVHMCMCYLWVLHKNTATDNTNKTSIERTK